MQNTLSTLIEHSVKKTFKEIGNNSAGLMFSAGVDSSLLAKIAQDLGFKPTLISLVTKNSKDISFIEKSAQFLNLPLKIYSPKETEFNEAIGIVRKLLTKAGVEETLMQLSLGVSVYFVYYFAKQLGINALISGQGPDELFAGYYKYTIIPPNKLQNALDDEVERIFKIDTKRDSAVAEFFGINLYTPYLTNQIIDFSKDVPIEYKLHKGQNKVILRQLAKAYNIPDFISKRPKKAMQYSTGVQRQVKKCLVQLHAN